MGNRGSKVPRNIEAKMIATFQIPSQSSPSPPPDNSRLYRIEQPESRGTWCSHVQYPEREKTWSHPEVRFGDQDGEEGFRLDKSSWRSSGQFPRESKLALLPWEQPTSFVDPSK